MQKVSGVGGSERHLLSLLPALRKVGVESVLCVLDAPGSADFKQLAREAGIVVVTIPAGGDLNPRLVKGLRREIDRASPDLVHTHLIHADAYGQIAARTSGVPAVQSLHSAIFQYWSAPVRTLLRGTSRMSKGVIAISRYVADTAVEVGLCATSPRVIHYGIDPGEWSFEDQTRELARLELGWQPDSFVVGVASRMIPRKGHDVLIDAFANVCSRADKAVLALAGDGPLRGELESRASAAGIADRCRFLGYVEDIKSFMVACDVVVFPTVAGLGEGFGLAALEAMAAGRPTVVTRVDALPEIVEDGVSGILVEPGSPDALADSLLSLFHDSALRDSLSSGALRRVEATFRADTMALETRSFYEEVLSEVSS